MEPKILLVEDDPFLSEIYLTSFKHKGFKINYAKDGKEALLMLEKENFDIVLLDLLLPEIDGFEILKRIKEKNIKTNIIVMSNLSGEEYLNKAKSLGVKGYILKSKFEPKEIVEKVKNFWENKGKNIKNK
jgi:DNA-binding response OmpR family regulator